MDKENNLSEVDEKICKNLSYEAFPLQNAIIITTTYDNIPFVCGAALRHNKKCHFSKSPDSSIALKGPSYIVDLNSEKRMNYYLKCMDEKGWIKNNVFLW